jgi:FkbM family methyltransferase
MIESGGIFLPDGEAHLLPYLADAPRVDGKATYQLHKLKLALGYVPRRRLAVDVGAHVGLWSRVLAMEFERVEAFEPVPAHRECFTCNVTANNVTLHAFALGAIKGQVSLVIAQGNSGSTHVATMGGGEVTADMATLDSFGFTDLDFLKIDCEGYEENVLKGGIETLKRCRPVLIVEQKPNNGRRYGRTDYDALKLLDRLGGKTVASKAGDYVVVL